jgi:hypothetical protein
MRWEWVIDKIIISFPVSIAGMGHGYARGEIVNKQYANGESTQTYQRRHGLETSVDFGDFISLKK